MPHHPFLSESPQAADGGPSPQAERQKAHAGAVRAVLLSPSRGRRGGQAGGLVGNMNASGGRGGLQSSFASSAVPVGEVRAATEEIDSKVASILRRTGLGLEAVPAQTVSLCAPHATHHLAGTGSRPLSRLDRTESSMTSLTRIGSSLTTSS